VKKFKIEKLIRNKILDNILSNKLNKVDYQILDKKSFLISLKKKFFEEIEELDFEDKENAIKELADLQLIINTCLKTLKINKKEFEKIGEDKNKKFGKFDKQIYVKTVDLDEKDDWFDYYVKKYKKIK
jgi:predicted house-cleaning noncanonical NTP pyrophosphatase (MazG superfamily)